MMKTKILGLMAVGLLAGPMTAMSAPVLNVDPNGRLLGASNVEIDGKLYDASFVDGSCADVFDGCDALSDFDFPVLADARAASQALMDTVLLDDPLGPFDSVPGLTNGCSLQFFYCYVMTPFALVESGTAFIAEVVNIDQEPDQVWDNFVASFNRDDETWVRWTRTSVPEPGTLALLGLGLAGLGLSRRRRVD